LSAVFSFLHFPVYRFSARDLSSPPFFFFPGSITNSPPFVPGFSCASRWHPLFCPINQLGVPLQNSTAGPWFLRLFVRQRLLFFQLPISELYRFFFLFNFVHLSLADLFRSRYRTRFFISFLVLWACYFSQFDDYCCPGSIRGMRLLPPPPSVASS